MAQEERRVVVPKTKNKKRLVICDLVGRFGDKARFDLVFPSLKKCINICWLLMV